MLIKVLLESYECELVDRISITQNKHMFYNYLKEMKCLFLQLTARDLRIKTELREEVLLWNEKAQQRQHRLWYTIQGSKVLAVITVACALI